jgi:putative component of membrane protein insertase Oxa1/YidC/SpoIIIJ protein YidD
LPVEIRRTLQCHAADGHGRDYLPKPIQLNAFNKRLASVIEQEKTFVAQGEGEG